MPTARETSTMQEVEIVVNLWKSKQTPTWRAIERIAAIILEHQKQDWKESH